MDLAASPDEGAWLWVLTNGEALEWVLNHGQMGFGQSAESRARRIKKGDRALLYLGKTSTGDRAPDRGRVVAAASIRSRPIRDPVVIAGRAYELSCDFRVEYQARQGSGPELKKFVEELEFIRIPQHYGGHLQNSPVELSCSDYRLLRGALTQGP